MIALQESLEVSNLSSALHQTFAGKEAHGASSDPSESPLVSIVIGTRNSAHNLRSCLESIAKQTYRPIEIIVVDNFSTDSTVEIARGFTNRVYSLGPERCSQYNLGFRVAKGELLYRADADYVLESDLIQEAVDQIKEGCDAVLIPDTVDASVSFWARVRALEQRCYVDDDWNVAARFFKASVLRALGGYDETLLAGEDYDLHNRLLRSGYRVGRIRALEMHLDEPRTLAEIYEKHYFYGKSIGRFLAGNEDRGIRQLLPIRTAFLRHWRAFVENPDLAAGFFVYQCVKYTAAWRGWSRARANRMPGRAAAPAVPRRGPMEPDHRG